jgi:hypothetical protein
MTKGELHKLITKNEELRLENGNLKARINIILSWCEVDGKELVLTAPIVDLLKGTDAQPPRKDRRLSDVLASSFGGLLGD